MILLHNAQSSRLPGRSGPRSEQALYLVFSGIVRLHWKIEGRTFRQTGHEIEHGKMQTASALAAPDTGQGRAAGGGRLRRLARGGGPLEAESVSGGRKHLAESFPGTGTVPGRAGWTARRRSCKENVYPQRGGMRGKSSRGRAALVPASEEGFNPGESGSARMALTLG